MAETVPILGLPAARFVDEAGRHGLTSGRARTVYQACHRDGVWPDASWCRTPEWRLGTEQWEDATCKFTVALADGLEVESVILPQRSRTGRPRTTLCVSSQVGCAMGCTFCETAQMGRMRDLAAEEIVLQRHVAQFVHGSRVTGIVFMGMGEPLDNVDAVLRAIETLADHDGAAIAPSRITVSTVGLVDGIERLDGFTRRVGLGSLRLAVSLNAPNDEIRSAIMPVNRAAPLDQLLASMHTWTSHRKRRVLVEYVVIPGVNDGDAAADEVARRLGDLPCTVNVIPYNPRRDSPWPAPTEATVDRFVARLSDGGLFVRRRRTMGRSVMAACGQLGNENIRRRRFVEPTVRPTRAASLTPPGDSRST